MLKKDPMACSDDSFELCQPQSNYSNADTTLPSEKISRVQHCKQCEIMTKQISEVEDERDWFRNACAEKEDTLEQFRNKIGEQ